jgi:hypothetical protein
MHRDFGSRLGEVQLMAAGMFWDVGWSLVLGSVALIALTGAINFSSPASTRCSAPLMAG